MFFSLTLILSGCSVSNKSTSNNDNNFANNQVGSRRPDFGQPERVADVRGVIKSVVGNEVTILEINMGAGRNSQNASTSSETEVNNQQKTAISLTGDSQAPGGRYGGGPGGMEGRNPGENSGDRADMLTQLKEMSTGE